MRGERGWLRREAEEDLFEDDATVQRGRRREPAHSSGEARVREAVWSEVDRGGGGEIDLTFAQSELLQFPY